MKNSLYAGYPVVILLFFTTGCSSESEGDNDDFLQVDTFKMSEEEFNSQLKFETQVDSSFHLSEKTRAEFMKDLIQTQLLIQEAKKLKRDEREKFRKTIERYWESTLIRDLINQKGDEIQSHTVVSEEEVTDYYNINKDNLEKQSLSEQLPELRKKVEDEKVARKLKNWISGLKNSTKVTIKDQKLLGEMKGETN